MNKAELVAAVAHGTDHNKAVVEQVLDALAVTTGRALARGEEVALPGIGKLKPKQRAARSGRNPRTGEAVEVQGKTVVKFAVSKHLADAVL